MKDAAVGEVGEEYVIGLEPAQREIYEDRVATFVGWGLTLADAQTVARSSASKWSVRKLLRAGVSPEMLRRIVE